MKTYGIKVICCIYRDHCDAQSIINEI